MEKQYSTDGYGLNVNIPNAPEHFIMEDTSEDWLKLLNKILHARTPIAANEEQPMLYIELKDKYTDDEAKNIYNDILSKNRPTTHKLIRLPNGKHGMAFIYPPSRKDDCHQALPNILYRRHPDMLRLYTGSIRWKTVLSEVGAA